MNGVFSATTPLQNGIKMKDTKSGNILLLQNVIDTNPLTGGEQNVVMFFTKVVKC